MKTLVVINPFSGRARGERITDPGTVAEILSGESACNVVASDHADAPGAIETPTQQRKRK